MLATGPPSAEQWCLVAAAAAEPRPGRGFGGQQADIWAVEVAVRLSEVGKVLEGHQVVPYVELQVVAVAAKLCGVRWVLEGHQIVPYIELQVVAIAARMFGVQ